MRFRRGTRREQGAQAEALACDHLQAHGLTLVQRNYQVRAGEIDLIMREGNETVFVEVRQRSRPDWGSAAESVTASKRRRLSRAAQHYLQRHGETPCRFDVVTIDGNGKPQWLRHAFDAEP